MKILLKIFHLLVDLRIFLYFSGIFKVKKVSSKVISIGNISFGGTGKTPLTIKIANNLILKGYKVAIVSRGYKRNDENSIKVVSDGKNIFINANEAGDEPYLIATKVKAPVIVGKDRYKACQLAIKNFSPDFILLDDAFQHLKLFRNKDIVLITQATILKKSVKLRESIKNLNRADIIILTKIFDYSKLRSNYAFLRKYTRAPIYKAEYFLKCFINLKTKEKLNLDEIRNKNFYVFCGIADPEFFKKMLRDSGIKIIQFISFKDHTRYDKNFYKNINKINDNTILLTTEKDAVKLEISKIKNDICIPELDVKISNIFQMH